MKNKRNILISGAGVVMATTTLFSINTLSIFSNQPDLNSLSPVSLIEVLDGDTIEVTNSLNKRLRIRLACIDAPELNQPTGESSSNRLKEVLSDSELHLREIDTDRYGRTIGELFIENNSINLQLVKEGYAVVYKQYISSCDSTRDKYFISEDSAKKQKLNFWNSSDPIMPWDWRKGIREPIKTSELDIANLPCLNSDCNCTDFQTQSQAQIVLDQDYKDPHQIDRDSDRVACESLP